MITKQEILDFAQITAIRPDVVEKDYVLSWILAGIQATKPNYTLDFQRWYLPQKMLL
jgi:hypothetical protein